MIKPSTTIATGSANSAQVPGWCVERAYQDHPEALDE